MRLLNPAGLWFLLGIPVLILIYLIRSHHEDRAVSSTYIWKLSNRFLKKRLPLQKLRRVLVFVLQLLILTSLSLMVAQPALVTGKSTQYIAIIDTSASMQTRGSDGVSRFDRALDQVQDLSDCVDKGHDLTVVLAGDKASMVLQNSRSANSIRLSLKRAKCGYGSSNLQAALDLILPLQQRGPTKIFYYTDRDMPGSENIQIRNLNRQEWNVSLDALIFSTTEDGDSYPTGILTSHNQDAELYVGLRMNGVVHSAYQVSCPADTPVEVHFPSLLNPKYDTLELFIDQKDGLTADNLISLCSAPERSYRVLIVSKSDLYLSTVFTTLGCLVDRVNMIPPEGLGSYDLYVFDGIYPSDYPTSGAILQFGTESLPRGLTRMSTHDVPTKLTKGQHSSLMYPDLSMTDTTVRRYQGLSGVGIWESFLYCQGMPVATTGLLENGQRITVIGFDLHESNLPLQADFVILMRNILRQSVQELLEKTDYTVGHEVPVRVLPATIELFVQKPDGTAVQLSTDGALAPFAPDLPGVYTVACRSSSGGALASFFVHIPQGEVLCAEAEPVYAGEGMPGSQDALTQLWPYLAGLLLLLILAEWGVYYYEQY